ncbi:MAG: ribbon-helix-helix protein, CopG family [Chloroflexi bacterium]|nr:ribbon-helix-helix protein, CopG family [Chloroflexota bacterium]
MTRTTVTIDDKKLNELRSLAAERGVSVSCLVREAIDEKLSKRPSPEGRRRRLSALGTGYSKEGPTARELGDVDPEIPPWR